MSGSTSVPVPVLADDGFSAPTEDAILDGAMADVNAAFGGKLTLANTDGSRKLDTPQGQLASSLAAIVADKNKQFRHYVSQVDPAFASGRMQDAIARIYFIERDPARPTTVPIVCRGAVGTPIPTGATAKSLDGYVYACTAGASIGADGTVTLPFACLTSGPIACPAGNFATPYAAIPGWDSVTNLVAGTTGNAVETRSAFEARRAASVALNATGSLPAVRGAVLAVSNVLDAYVTENATTADAAIGGVLVPAHTLYVAATGGDPAAIGFAIWRKKAPGCGTMGDTALTITDDAYATPKPSYVIRFQQAVPAPVRFAVVLARSPGVPADAAARVQAAIISAFGGGDGGERARIGATLYASRFYAPVASLGSWARIVSLELGLDAPDQFSVPINIDHIPTVTAGDIGVTLA